MEKKQRWKCAIDDMFTIYVIRNHMGYWSYQIVGYKQVTRNGETVILDKKRKYTIASSKKDQKFSGFATTYIVSILSLFDIIQRYNLDFNRYLQIVAKVQPVKKNETNKGNSKEVVL